MQSPMTAFSQGQSASTNKRIPVNAALLVLAFRVAISCTIVGSKIAFFALTVTATIATNVSYVILVIARQTIGRKAVQSC
jgi:hypothetical protein